MTIATRLREVSERYETLSEWHAERAPMDGAHSIASTASLTIAIVLRELAETFEHEDVAA